MRSFAFHWWDHDTDNSREENGSVVGNKCKENQNKGTNNPSELSNTPWKCQDSESHNRCDWWRVWWWGSFVWWWWFFSLGERLQGLLELRRVTILRERGHLRWHIQGALLQLSSTPVPPTTTHIRGRRWRGRRHQEIHW